MLRCSVANSILQNSILERKEFPSWWTKLLWLKCAVPKYVEVNLKNILRTVESAIVTGSSLKLHICTAQKGTAKRTTRWGVTLVVTWLTFPYCCEIVVVCCEIYYFTYIDKDSCCNSGLSLSNIVELVWYWANLVSGTNATQWTGRQQSHSCRL